jgi:alkylated DNA nucleotide flippase Atl1
LQAKEMTLEPILEGQKQYLVPLYQRTYSWQREQLDRLWADIIAQADALRDGSTGPGHFIGSLVLAPAPNVVAGGVARWLVVDGQQRLTTLLLALAALRDHVRPESPQDADRVHRQCLVNEWQTGDDHLKLLPTQTDRPAFLACIIGTHKPGGGNVAAAYRFFREQLVAVDDPDDPHDVRRIEQAIRSRLDLVSVTADHDDNVHRIFESLNNTGMKLTLGDLLRNYLFMLLPTRAEAVYEKIWSPMQDVLGAEHVETLAYLDLQLRGHPELRRSDTYQEQQRRFRPLEHDESAVEAEIVQLARRAAHLHVIIEPDAADHPEVSAGLRRLKAWGTEAVQPILMVLLDRRERGAGAADETVAAMLHLESYLVRRMLCGRTAAGINRALAQAAVEIAGAADAADALREFLSQPRRQWPDDEQLASGINGLNFYWIGKGSQRLFVLRRLEESYGHKELINWVDTKVQIEHVLPQTPTPEWLDDLEPDVDPGESATDLHERIVHRLGNLTVTGYNPDLSNKPFVEKRALLEQSHFSMSRELAEQETWGLQQIEGRGRALAARAAEVWPGPARTSVAAPQDQWRVVRQVCASLPEGTWTAYGDVAAVTGIHPKPLGNYLATTSVPNAWRVLRSDGSVSPEFRWSDPAVTDKPRDVLAREGVQFDDKSRADSSQRLNPRELAALLGLDVTDDMAGPDMGREQRFWIQLRASQPAAVVEAVTRLIEDWHERGGYLECGSGAQVVAFPSVRAGGEQYWPWNIRPTAGSVEVVFQHLLSRQPFADTALRDELRKRINRIPGVELPLSRLELRPSFPVNRLADEAGLQAAIEAHNWFLNQLPTKTEHA